MSYTKEGLGKWLGDKYIERHFSDDCFHECWEFPDGDVTLWFFDIYLECYYEDEETQEFIHNLLWGSIIYHFTFGDVLKVANELVEIELKRIQEEED